MLSLAPEQEVLLQELLATHAQLLSYLSGLRANMCVYADDNQILQRSTISQAYNTAWQQLQLLGKDIFERMSRVSESQATLLKNFHLQELGIEPETQEGEGQKMIDGLYGEMDTFEERFRVIRAGLEDESLS